MKRGDTMQLQVDSNLTIGWLNMSERPSDVRLAEIISEPFHANTTQYSLSMKPVHQSSLNQSPCQLSILWDFVHFSGCGILSCGILSCGILSVGILSCGILSCGILSGYRIQLASSKDNRAKYRGIDSLPPKLDVECGK